MRWLAAAVVMACLLLLWWMQWRAVRDVQRWRDRAATAQAQLTELMRQTGAYRCACGAWITSGGWWVAGGVRHDEAACTPLDEL